MSIQLKSTTEIAKLREANLVVADVLDRLQEAAKPGITTMELNEIAAARLRQLKAEPAFLGYHGYPAVLCTSVNEVVVHGIPRKDVVLKDGDIIGIDFGCFKEGYCGDSARTVAIGRISEEAQKLLDVTRRALELGIEQYRPGQRLQDIGWAVQEYVQKHGFSVVKDFVGHG